jgi:TonB family protein
MLPNKPNVPLAITLAILFFCAPKWGLAQKAASSERVTQIADAESLVRPGSVPWHLRMTFQLFDLKGKASEQGIIEEWWAAPDVYRRVITSPSYSATVPGDDTQTKTSRRTKYLVNLLLDQLVDPIPHYGDFKDLNVTEEKRKFGMVELTCYSVLRAGLPSREPQTQNHPEFCIDEGGTDLRIRFDSGNFVAVRNRMARFRGIQLGLDNVLSYSGTEAISGHVETLESYDLAKYPQAMTKAHEAAQPVPDIILAGKVIRKEQPVYPETAKLRHLTGTVILSAIISKEGRISSVEAIASPDVSLSDSAVAAVKNWTYTPYLLDGEPTEVDTTITVNYNLSRY